MFWIIVILIGVIFLVVRNTSKNANSKTEEKKVFRNENSLTKDNNSISTNKLVTSNSVKDFSDLKEEKDLAFENYYAEFKDSDISKLNSIIESEKKSSYEDYSLDDKMKFKALKTLIEEKRKVDDTDRIKNQLQNIKLNDNLIESIKENYITVNEIDEIIHSINFNQLNYSEETKINNLLELKKSMTTKQFYEIAFNQTYCDDIEEVSFDYEYLSDGKFNIKRKYKENGIEYGSNSCGYMITKEQIDYYKAKEKENSELIYAISLYVKIIESESTPIITYINTAERISIILGKEKLYETDYHFLSNVFSVINESSKFENIGYFNPEIISKRLEKAEKKINKNR